MAHLTEREKACLRFLCDWFEHKDSFYSASSGEFLINGVRLEQVEFAALMEMMEGYGAIRDIHRFSDGSWDFYITPVAVQMAREIESEAAMDLVDSMMLTLRRRPFTAWPFMFILAIVFIATAIHQIAGAIKDILDFLK